MTLSWFAVIDGTEAELPEQLGLWHSASLATERADEWRQSARSDVADTDVQCGLPSPEVDTASFPESSPENQETESPG